MGYKVIACDMDETLLTDNHEICQKNIDAIQKAKKEYGVKFVPATGRGYITIQENLKTLGLYDEPNEYVLSFNGGALTENKGNRILQFKDIPFDKIQELFNFGLTKDVCIHVYTQEEVYLYNLNDDEEARMKKQGFGTKREENTIDFLKEEKIVKILYQNLDTNYLQEIGKELESITKGCCEVSYSSNRYLEINGRGINKGQGLYDLVEILGIDISETIAVGDNYNDIPMLKEAGLSVAAGNAVEGVKEIVDYVTEATNNDGVVAELIEKYIFNE